MTIHHSILGVSVGATEKEIRKAFREKAKSLHPDAVGSTPATKAAWKELNEAKDSLLANLQCKPQQKSQPQPRTRKKNWKIPAQKKPPVGFITWEEFGEHAYAKDEFFRRNKFHSANLSWELHYLRHLMNEDEDRFDPETHVDYEASYKLFVEKRLEVEEEQRQKKAREYEAKTKTKEYQDALAAQRLVDEARSKKHDQMMRDLEAHSDIVDLIHSWILRFMLFVYIGLIVLMIYSM